jgi:hypothetical protein
MECLSYRSSVAAAMPSRAQPHDVENGPPEIAAGR